MLVPLVVTAIVYAIALTWLAIIGARQTKSEADYWLGGRRLGGVVSGFSYAASLLSASGVIGAAGLAFGVGSTIVMWMILFNLLAFPVMFLYLGPRIRVDTERLGALTIPHFFGLRYGSKQIHLWAAIGILAMLIPAMVVQYRAAGLLFETVLKVPYIWSVLVVGIGVTLYVAYGGYLSVSYSDVLQGCLMILGLTWLSLLVIAKFGGLPALVAQYGQVNPKLLSHGGLFPPLLAFSLAFSFFVGGIGAPHVAKRMFSIANDRKAFGIGLAIAAVIEALVICSIIVAMGGRLMFPNLQPADSVIFVVSTAIANPWLASLFLITMLAALMSTIDSILLVAGSSVIEDIYQRVGGRQLEHGQAIRYGRWGTFVIGIIATLISLYPPQFITVLMAKVMGAMGIVVGIPLALAVIWPRFNKAGVWASWLVALVTYVGAWLLKSPVPEFLVGLVMGLVAALVVGAVTGKPEPGRRPAARAGTGD